MRTPLFFSIAIICILSHATIAYGQSWQWGKRGGSDGNFSTGRNEKVKDMAVDRNGNIYVLANSGSTSGIDIAGQPKTGKGDQDVIVASFNCNGALRWSKIIGTSYYADGPFALQTDKLDGVYIAVGSFRGPDKRPLYIDNDMTISDTFQKDLYFIKYDTAGHLKWVRDPQPDTVTAGQQAVTIDMSVDSAGNVYALCQLPPGLYGGVGGFVATTAYTSIGHDYADCMLKYDRNGNFLGGFNWDAQGCYGAKMTRDAKTGKYYITAATGSSSLPIGSTLIPPSNGYVACFDKNGKYLWDLHSNAAGFVDRPLVDDADNLFLNGVILPPSTSNPGANFNGFMVGPDVKTSSVPFIIKIDSNKKNIWAKYALVNASPFPSSIAIRNSGEVILNGFFAGLLQWPGYSKDTFNFPPNSGYMPCITRFNTHTGRILGLHKLITDGNSADDDKIVADERGNVYIGGPFKGGLTVNGNSMYNVGGRNDWYVAKFGHNNCGCTNIPEPKFSFNRTTPTSVSFSYTGSTYSSIEWDFDDGKTSTQASPVHLYDSIGIYTVCVKVINSCGDNTYCATIPMWPAGINETANDDGPTVYPNAVSDRLKIEGLTVGTVLQVYDMTGKKIYHQVIESSNTEINMSVYPPGIYLLKFTGEDGQAVSKTIVKN